MKLALFSSLTAATAAFCPSSVQSNAKINTSLDAISRRDVLGWIPAVAFATLPAVANAAGKAKAEKAPEEEAPVEKATKAKNTSTKKTSVKATAEKETTATAKAEPVASAIISDFPGVYSDPKHPKGYRVIISAGSKVSMQLQDDPAGKVFSIPIKVKNDKKVGTLLTIDFSPKGGPKNIVGTVEKKGKISFPDGNVWSKTTGIVGVYSDPKHPKGYRVIRKDASGIVVALSDSGSTSKEITIPAKASKTSVEFDFSSKGGPASLKGTVKEGVITFPDGNTWTKL